MLRVVTDDSGRAEMCSALGEIVLAGAQRMLGVALEAEGRYRGLYPARVSESQKVDAYIAGLADQLDDGGRRLVARNGGSAGRAVRDRRASEPTLPTETRRARKPAAQRLFPARKSQTR